MNHNFEIFYGKMWATLTRPLTDTEALIRLMGSLMQHTMQHTDVASAPLAGTAA
jgi:hypothetical protein